MNHGLDAIMNSAFLLDRFKSVTLKITQERGFGIVEIPKPMILLYLVERIMKLSKMG